MSQDEAGGEPQKRRRSGVRDFVGLGAIALAAFLVGFYVFNAVLMPQFIHSSSEVLVPDLANLTVDQAEHALKPLGLSLSRSGERFDASAPRGFILAQDPPPATPVRGNRRVQVTVSLGEEYSSVPELFGESRRGARLLLERAGLRVGGLTRAPNDEVGDGLISGSDPPAESVLPCGEAVALLVSTGPSEEDFMMPDLTGREINGVRRQFEALGFHVSTPPGAPSVGAVTNQSPPAGSRVTRDAQVVLQGSGRVIR